jgi:hypothetical protein
MPVATARQCRDTVNMHYPGEMIRDRHAIMISIVGSMAPLENAVIGATRYFTRSSERLPMLFMSAQFLD